MWHPKEFHGARDTERHDLVVNCSTLYYPLCYKPKRFCFCGNTELSFPNVIDSCQAVESQNKDKFRTVCTNDTVHCAGCEVSFCHIVITNKINSSPFSRWALCCLGAAALEHQQTLIGKTRSAKRMCKVELLSGQIAAWGMISCWISTFENNLARVIATENKQNPQTAMMDALRVWGAGAQEIYRLLYFSSNSGIAQWFTSVINSVVGQGNSQLLNLHFKSEQFPALSSCLVFLPPSVFGGKRWCSVRNSGWHINGLYPFVFLSLFFNQGLLLLCWPSPQGVAFTHMNTPSL